MLVVHATFPIAAEHRERATDLIRELAEESRQEEGIIEYRVAVDVDDENRYRFFERYEDDAAIGAHAQTDHFERVAAALPEPLAGEPEVTRFEVESATAVDL